MSVLLETSLGDLVIDLEVDKCPLACRNFLKLAKKYRYNYNAFFMVQKNFTAQTGDPSSSGKGGASIFNQLPEDSASYCPSPYFVPEMVPSLKHTSKGVVSFALKPVSVSSARSLPGFTESAISDQGTVLVGASQFFLTLSKEPLDYLDGRHAVFGKVVEDLDPAVLESDPDAKGTMDKINEAFTDQEYRPLRDIRIKHVVVLDDPFDDPEGLDVPSRTPSPTPSQLASIRLDDTVGAEEEELDAEAAEEKRRKADTNAAALTLEMVGDLPFAEVRPPENILFVCKLNPVTRSEDLELLFSRFGTILSCEVIKDKKTGDSLQYAFIEFDRKGDAEQAYFKMQNVLIDDRRIWVDFSQSVSKLHGSWVEGRTKGSRGGAGTRQGAATGAPDKGDSRRGGRGGDEVGRRGDSGSSSDRPDRGYGGRGYGERGARDDGETRGYRDDRYGARERSPRGSREGARERYRGEDRERDGRSTWAGRETERDRGAHGQRRHDGDRERDRRGVEGPRENRRDREWDRDHRRHGDPDRQRDGRGYDEDRRGHRR